MITPLPLDLEPLDIVDLVNCLACLFEAPVTEDTDHDYEIDCRIFANRLEELGFQPTSRVAQLMASAAISVLLANELGQEVASDQEG